ncbi:MAG: transglutaminase family protein [Polymorphobacter sp.]
MIDEIEADIAELGLLEDDEILLDEAALLLSRADDPDLEIEDAIHQLDVLEMSIRINDGLAGSPAEMAQQLAEAVAERHGISGDRGDYDNPRNADFSVMLDLCRGLPVTLSILYVVLARRFGVEAVPIGLPGHVVVRIGSGDDAVLIDPFNDGMPVDRDAPLLQGRAISNCVMSNRAALVRLLSNQASRAHDAGDLPRALVLARRMSLLAPGFTGVWWERAQLEQRLGDHAAARGSLAAMRETTRDPNTQSRIDATLAGLAR